jgi:hypothetical protein
MEYRAHLYSMKKERESRRDLEREVETECASHVHKFTYMCVNK